VANRVEPACPCCYRPVDRMRLTSTIGFTRPHLLLAAAALGLSLGLVTSLGCATQMCTSQCDSQHPGEGHRTTVLGDLVNPTARWNVCHERCMVANNPRNTKAAAAAAAAPIEGPTANDSQYDYIEREMNGANELLGNGQLDDAYIIYNELCGLYSYFPACEAMLGRAKQLSAEGKVPEGEAILAELCGKRNYGPACYEQELHAASSASEANAGDTGEGETPAGAPLPTEAEPACKQSIKSHCVASCEDRSAAERGPCEVQCMQRPLSDFDGTLKECTPSLLGY
jgi:hypothetical protein